MDTLIGRLVRILLDPLLVYHAQFSTPTLPMVLVNSIGAGPLMVVTTGPGPLTPQTPLEQPQADGVVFRATRDPVQADVVAMVALSPLPPGLPGRFTLVTDFYLPPDIGPWSVGVQWSATTGIRNSDDADDPNFKLVGATHQVRNLAASDEPNPGTVKIALGAGSGATAGTITPPPKNELIEGPVAYPDGRRAFRLETDIYRDLWKGWSRLQTPGHSWTERAWEFDAGTFPQITGVVFGQAFASGAGAATVTATEFRICDITKWWWKLLTSVLLDLESTGQ
jgi:hypothetical protein